MSIWSARSDEDGTTRHSRMTGDMARGYDVAIIGAGPVGSLCALAHARKGARVALFEANPRSSQRLAGEWLHPPAVRILREFGIEDPGAQTFKPTGAGFVIFPEAGAQPVAFPYPGESRALTCEHASLVQSLREAVADDPDIALFFGSRAHAIEDGKVIFTHNGNQETLAAPRVIGADGQASIVRKSLGLSRGPIICSQTVGVVLNGITLPFEGYGHVLLGGPGPILMYRLDDDQVRLMADIPMGHTKPRERVNFLLDSYLDLLPHPLRSAFMEALRGKQFQVGANKLRPHLTYGSSRCVLIGDAAGHYHPMTAMGMTFGFGDAVALADNENFKDFVEKRFRATRVSPFLAMGLYEVFTDHRVEAVALRHAIYHSARINPAFRDRTMRLLGCEDISAVGMVGAFFRTVARAVFAQIPRTLNRLAWRKAGNANCALAVRIGWLLRSIWRLSRARSGSGALSGQDWSALSKVFQNSMPSQVRAPQPGPPAEFVSPDADSGLKLATSRLLELQGEDGSWEGEMVWCPMLTAQYVLLHHIMEKPVESGRCQLILRSFAQTRLDGGLWGMHERSEPHLFVTTLVYVAARLLGVPKDDPLLRPASQFLQTRGVVDIPSWGKFWLALLNLYDWRGVNVILPELWALPRRLAIHPSNWYCHTRLIYMAMSAIYPHRFQAPVTPVIVSLREELFAEGFANVDFSTAGSRLRDGDLYVRPGFWLRTGYRVARIYERYHTQRLRNRCLDRINRHIKWELQTTDHTSISPVSGMLNILALWIRDADDPDCLRALQRLNGWIWEDEDNGMRVTGARSASWDTGFALQALTTVSDIDGVENAMSDGADFLMRQQIRTSFEGFREAWRNDPRGGWCFAGGWHGWPVTDCTAEATLGLIATHTQAADTARLGEAVQFMLRGQNGDGGFGSYEARRSRFGLEWLNPAEMFGDSMTENSYVECTASCLAAFAACRRYLPDNIERAVMKAITRADVWLRRSQGYDGSWRGVWGVQFIYGTLFGIRGLLAAGAHPGDPAVRLACRWLLNQQHSNGGWGEHHSGCLSGRYVAHEESQVIQTAWAMIALLEARDSNWNAISRGARFLLDAQQADGSWPRQEMVGVFFRTALLDYALYRMYFPLHALGLYQQRLRSRLELTGSAQSNDNTGQTEAVYVAERVSARTALPEPASVGLSG